MVVTSQVVAEEQRSTFSRLNPSESCARLPTLCNLPARAVVPGCGGELRQIDRQVPCPECRATLRIETAGSPGEVTVTMVAAAEPLKRAESVPTVLKAAAAGQQPVPAWRSDSTKRTDRPIAKPVSQPDGSLEPEKPARPQVSRDSRPAPGLLSPW